MATLAQNVYRAIDDFNAIENAIVGKGVPVPAGTPTSEYAEKVEDVFEAGQREFMEEYLDYGKRTHFDYAFAGRGWTNDTFKPTRNITPKEGVYMMFSGCMITDITNSLEECGVVFDSSDYNGDFLYFMYNNYHTVRFPALDTRSSALLKYTFYNARSLLKIDKFILRDDGSQTFGYAPISYCVVLEDLTIEGKIGSDNFNVSHSPLSKASLVSIVNALSSTTTGLTVTLRLDAVNTAFETTAGAADGSTSDEWTALIATKPNWTINLINS